MKGVLEIANRLNFKNFIVYKWLKNSISTYKELGLNFISK